MKLQYEQYLHSLLNWAQEVEEKVENSPYVRLTEHWKRDLNNWKGQIRKLIEESSQITKEQMTQIKKSGEQLVQFLVEETREENFISVGMHRLPPLPYRYDALEPYISKEIMELHHKVHHQSYVDGLNKAEKMIEKWQESQNSGILRHWMREQSFNGSGHFLHSIFWTNMSPEGGGEPRGALAEKINDDFSNFNRFKQLFTHAAKSVQGSGWTMLVWEIPSGRLAIQTVEKHNMYSLWNVIPILVFDLWEHAYYLQYKTDRDQYIENWWNVVNWNDVESRFNNIKDMKM